MEKPKSILFGTSGAWNPLDVVTIVLLLVPEGTGTGTDLVGIFCSFLFFSCEFM